MEKNIIENKHLFLIGIGILTAALVLALFMTRKTDTNRIVENLPKSSDLQTTDVSEKNPTSSVEVSETPLPKADETILLETPIGKLEVPLVLNPPPNWKTVGTSIRHLIQVPATAKLSVNGKALEYGDYLGAFYQSGNELKVAGFLMWKGETDTLYVWGDYPDTPEKDGYATGELFKWKIWKNLEKKMYSANAEFFPVGYGSSTATNTWVSGGISTFKSLVGAIE